MEVKQISYNETKPFLLTIHYARRMPQIQYAYGLFNDNELIGVATYGQPASPSLCKGIGGEGHKHDVLELNRLALKPNCPKNSASTLVGRSLRLLPKNKYIVSYADVEGWGHIGYVYQATNWYYTGITKRRTDIYSGNKKHSRHYDKTETRRQIRTAKHRYVYITGRNKELLKDLKYPIIKQYPKGDSVHYDIDNPIPIDKQIGKIL